MSEYKVEILAPAWQEIEEIAETHLSLVGPVSAQKITDKILADIELLKTNPSIKTIFSRDRRIFCGTLFNATIGQHYTLFRLTNSSDPSVI